MNRTNADALQDLLAAQESGNAAARPTDAAIAELLDTAHRISSGDPMPAERAGAMRAALVTRAATVYPPQRRDRGADLTRLGLMVVAILLLGGAVIRLTRTPAMSPVAGGAGVAVAPAAEQVSAPPATPVLRHRLVLTRPKSTDVVVAVLATPQLGRPDAPGASGPTPVRAVQPVSQPALPTISPTVLPTLSATLVATDVPEEDEDDDEDPDLSRRVVSARVLDMAGNPIRGAVVIAEAVGDGCPPEALADTDPDGSYRLALLPCAYRVSAEAPGFTKRWWPDAADAAEADILTIAVLDELLALEFHLPAATGLNDVETPTPTSTATVEALP